VNSIRKSKLNVWAAAAVTISIATMAVWQFRLFVIAQGSQGIADMSGGAHHLWWAVGAGLVACVASFYVFSVLVQYDQGDETSII
jgi:cytosine/uracil/thiamine/allantoin permease